MNDTGDRERYSSDPVDYGIDLSVLSAQQKQTWELQERFLDAYAGRGTKADLPQFYVPVVMLVLQDLEQAG